MTMASRAAPMASLPISTVRHHRSHQVRVTADAFGRPPAPDVHPTAFAPHNEAGDVTKTRDRDDSASRIIRTVAMAATIASGGRTKPSHHKRAPSEAPRSSLASGARRTRYELRQLAIDDEPPPTARTFDSSSTSRRTCPNLPSPPAADISSRPRPPTHNRTAAVVVSSPLLDRAPDEATTRTPAPGARGIAATPRNKAFWATMFTMMASSLLEEEQAAC